MEYIYLGMGFIIFLLLVTVGWLKRICYVMIEVWRVSMDNSGGDILAWPRIDLYISRRLGKKVSKDLAKQWYTLTRGEK